MSGDDRPEHIRCDALSCDESHPLEHDEAGTPGFEAGKWFGWFYLDLNRPDLAGRPLRFCSFACLRWWVNETKTADRAVAPENLHYYVPSKARPADLAGRRRKRYGRPSERP